MKKWMKPETQAWLYNILKSQQPTSLNISRSHASCPLAITVIKQLMNCGTRTPMPKHVGKQKIRAGHSVPCQGSDWGLGDLPSPHSTVLLIRNEQQYFTGRAASCCRLGEMEETAYASNFEDGWVGRVISRLCKWKNQSCSIQSSSHESLKWDHCGF